MGVAGAFLRTTRYPRPVLFLSEMVCANATDVVWAHGYTSMHATQRHVAGATTPKGRPDHAAPARVFPSECPEGQTKNARPPAGVGFRGGGCFADGGGAAAAWPGGGRTKTHAFFENR